MSVSKKDQNRKEVTIYEAFRGKTDADRERALAYISRGGCLTESDDNNMTLLHHAAFGGDIAIITSLVDVVCNGGSTVPVVASAGVAGASPSTTMSGQRLDLDAGDTDGWTALHYAADRGHAEVIALLVSEAGANANARDFSKRTPLHLAALGGHKQVVEALLKGGGLKSAKNAVGMTPADCAKAAGHEDVAALLA